MAMIKNVSRRAVLQSASIALAATALPRVLRAGEVSTTGRTFEPKPGKWRNFEVTTTVQLHEPPADATVWVPIPVVNTKWQRSLASEAKSNGLQTNLETDTESGARFVVAQFKA